MTKSRLPSSVLLKLGLAKCKPIIRGLRVFNHKYKFVFDLYSQKACLKNGALVVSVVDKITSDSHLVRASCSICGQNWYLYSSVVDKIDTSKLKVGYKIPRIKDTSTLERDSSIYR